MCVWFFFFSRQIVIHTQDETQDVLGVKILKHFVFVERMEGLHTIFPLKFNVRQKKVVLPSSGISEYLGRLVGKYCFFKTSTQSTTFGCIFYCFSQKGEKTPNLTKVGCISDPNLFVLFLEMDRSLMRATQHFFFLA